MTNGAKTKKRLTKSQLTARREKTVAFIVLAIAAFLFIFPLIYMLGTSFKSDLDLQMHPEKIFPTPGQWTLKHYNGFFITHSGELDNMPKWMINSIWSTAAAVLLTLLTDLIVAYVVVFLRWKGKKVFMKALFAWMAAPAVIGTAPGLMIFQTVRNTLGVSSQAGTYALVYFWMIVPGITGVFNVILMRNFFNTIPVDIQKDSLPACKVNDDGNRPVHVCGVLEQFARAAASDGGRGSVYPNYHRCACRKLRRKFCLGRARRVYGDGGILIDTGTHNIHLHAK